MKKSRFFFPLFLAFFMASCLGMKGEFGWAILDEEQLDFLEKRMTNISEFTLTRDKLAFPNDKTLAYIYKFSRLPNPEAETYVSLSRFQLGFNEIEVSRKRPDLSTSTIRGSFRDLPTGKYLLKVSYDEDVIDSVEFRIVSPEGTAEEDEDGSSNSDDIEKYSKTRNGKD
ncbi:putative lipoprotein [Leptospira broomii serovar Hurstbridge str. 5399]|uniref:Lipoprotein n=1 Tax=Leptospira broomii serovar Hurstbridge str. 5399 TaxID=1049789 RepID=T0F7I1_9LEPT|nr:hypothetical protein [Leptospira broomii]EQA43871.1 putative lipoprotein [Leptospira broomii serovar Hurstbridge str. 5399]